MSVLDEAFKECERKLQFGCDKNYSDEEMVQMAETYRKRVKFAKIKYYLKKIIHYLLSI